jgi:hypothetical protein
MTTLDKLSRTDGPAFREIEGFEHIHLDCSANTYSRALRHHGLDPRILGAEWGYWYVPEKHAFPLFGLQVARRSRELAIRDWYGCRALTIDHENAAAAWTSIRATVASGNVSIIDVDLHEWPLSTFHQKLHYPHRVIVAACRGDHVLVLDGRAKNRFVGWMSTQNVTRAMNTTQLSILDFGVHSSGVNRTTELLPPAAEQNITLAPERFRDALVANVSRYLEKHHDLGEPYGHLLIKMFAADLAAYLAAAAEIPDELVMPSMGILGEPASQWRLAALFLEQASAHLELDLTRSAQRFEKISAAWTKVFNTFFLGYHGGRDRIGLLKLVVNRTTAIADDELRAVTELAALLEFH